MVTTMDKFGRVLFPKNLREVSGCKAGTQFELKWDTEKTQFILAPINQPTPYVEITDWGWPVIRYPGHDKVDFDVKEFIKEGYEERSNKLLGIND